MSGREGDEGVVLDAITDEEAEAAARRDPDNPPLADEAWEAGLRREAERDRYGVARLRRRLRIRRSRSPSATASRSAPCAMGAGRARAGRGGAAAAAGDRGAPRSRGRRGREGSRLTGPPQAARCSGRRRVSAAG